MHPETFRTLLTPAGQEILQQAMKLEPREVDFLAHFQRLSRRYPREVARIALEIATLRAEAAVKFPQAGKMYFTRTALEQASSWEVSAHRAVRYRGLDKLVDLGCSIGGDALVLGSNQPTLGIDRDGIRLLMARANAQALGLEGTVAIVQADLKQELPVGGNPDSMGLFFDPSRRAEGRRAHTVEGYHPPLSIIESWLPAFPSLGVKISPGVDLREVASYRAEVEFVSLHGELKEAVLWFGPLRTCRRRATILPGPHTLSDDLPDQERPERLIPVSPPQAWLYEPDPAVLRADLIQPLGARLEAAQLDPTIAYLTADRLQPTPFARHWAVEDWFPFQLKRLRAYLRQRKIGQVTVKKRGSPLQPQELIRDLRLEGHRERVIFLTQQEGRPIVVVARPE